MRWAPHRSQDPVEKGSVRNTQRPFRGVAVGSCATGTREPRSGPEGSSSQRSYLCAADRLAAMLPGTGVRGW